MDDKLKQINRILAAFDTNAMSSEEITKGFQAIIKHVEDNKAITQKEVEVLREIYQKSTSLTENSRKEFEQLRTTLVRTIEQKLSTLKDGKDGKDGRDGKNGKDGLNGKDGKNGVDGINGLNGRNGKDGKDGGGGLRIGWGAHPLQIRDGTTVIDKVARVINFGTNLTATRSADGVITVNASGGSGFTELTATGTVNGINKVFTFSQTPSYVVADGAWYKATDNNGVVQWSGTTTVTMIIPPQSAIFGVA